MAKSRNYNITFNAKNRLYRSGHTKIGYLSSALEAYVYKRRYEAFLQALTTCGLQADKSLCGCAYFINECMQHLPTLLEKGWITALPGAKDSRKKEYQITNLGKEAVTAEIIRLQELLKNGRQIMGGQAQ